MTDTTIPTDAGARPRVRAGRLTRLLIGAVLATAVIGSAMAVESRYAGGLLIGQGQAGDPLPRLLATAVWVVMTVAAAGAWVAWTRSVDDTLAGLGRPPDHPRWWITGGWLLPPFCWFAPVAVMMSMWRRSTPGPAGRRSRWVPVWWLLYLVGNPTVIAGAATVGAWRVALYSSLAWLAAGLIGLRLVVRITTRTLMFAEMAGAAETGWRAVQRRERSIPTLVGLVVVVGFVGYQGFAISASLVGAINGWQVEDALPGLCFGGVAGPSITAVVDTPCHEPHRGEVVGAHLVQGGPESAWDASRLETFALGWCRAAAEAYTGVRAGVLDEDLVVTIPTRGDWRVHGERDVTCLLLVEEGSTGSVADPSRARVPYGSLRPGDCFVDETGWVTARRSACTTPARRVTGQEIADRTVTSPHPGTAAMDRIAERVCPPGSVGDPPSIIEWQQGLRTVLCTEPA